MSNRGRIQCHSTEHDGCLHLRAKLWSFGNVSHEALLLIYSEYVSCLLSPEVVNDSRHITHPVTICYQLMSTVLQPPVLTSGGYTHSKAWIHGFFSALGGGLYTIRM